MFIEGAFALAIYACVFCIVLHFEVFTLVRKINVTTSKKQFNAENVFVNVKCQRALKLNCHMPF